MSKAIQVAFFTEVGRSRGMGHAVRSYAILEGFKSIGAETYFFLDSDELFDKQFPDAAYFSWSDLSFSKHYDIIFIDSYEASLDVYQKASLSCKVVVYVDDFRRLPYPNGVILNFSPGAEKTFYGEKEDGRIYLLGLKYLPIRKGLLSINKVRTKKQIFIMLGGTDVRNLSEDVLQSVDSQNVDKVVVSSSMDTVNRLKQYSNVKVLYRPSDKELFKAMAGSSVAISTASMSAYELAFLRIPNIAIAVADNQETGLVKFLEYNIVRDYVSIESQNWKRRLAKKVRRALLFAKEIECRQLIDGKGSGNIVNEVLRLLK